VYVPYVLLKQYLFESGFGGTSQLETNNVMSFISNIFLLNSMGLHDHLSWNSPAWSISTEFFAYIVFFLFTKKLDTKESLICPFLISVGCYSFLVSLDRNSLDITYDYGFFRCLAAFYLGVFVNR
jgi:peptidoglycan/LPS O-acetylase OafA/YrhL